MIWKLSSLAAPPVPPKQSLYCVVDFWVSVYLSLFLCVCVFLCIFIIFLLLLASASFWEDVLYSIIVQALTRTPAIKKVRCYFSLLNFFRILIFIFIQGFPLVLPIGVEEKLYTCADVAFEIKLLGFEGRLTHLSLIIFLFIYWAIIK